MPHYLPTNLKVLRASMGWSQADVAEMCNQKRSTYATYEQGGAEPNITTLLLLRDALRVPLNLFLDFDLSTKPHYWIEQMQRKYLVDKQVGAL